MNRLAFLLIAVLLFACSPTIDIDSVPSDDNADEANVATSETITATPAPTETSEDTTVNGQDSYAREDNRPSNIRAHTSSWNTNFDLRAIEWDEVRSGGPPRDGIPSIDNPQFVNFGDADMWVADVEPVVSLEVNGEARAYPLQVLTWHEIVNDQIGGVPVVVTFCPLCNSAIVFDRRINGDTVEFGVSGLLRNSDLIMYDRTTETLWQQFTGEGLVGDLTGEQLDFLPSQLISYANFKDAYPDGQVLSKATGHNRAYGQNPYVGYDTLPGRPFLFSGETDERLAPVDRVVTVRFTEEAVDVAYPVVTLAEMGAINDEPAGQPIVVFHLPGTTSALGDALIEHSEDVGATAVFSRIVSDQTLTFSRDGDHFVDAETGTKWNIAGHAVEGELVGEELTQIVAADHFWFSWVAFRPNTIIYQP